MLLRKIAVAAPAAILRIAVAAAAALLTLTTATVPAAAATTETSPASTSDATLAGRNPVIVVGGLSGLSTVYEPLASRLWWDGYQVYIYQLPNLGVGDIPTSARAFADFVARVRAETGAARVDLVAHSEGGLVSRYLLKYLGGTSSVQRYISLGTPQYGTYVANIARFLGVGSCLGIVACQQMTIGSDFLTDLNDGDDTPGAVRYTTVRTLQDELVQPVDTAKLADGATNVLIQAYCPLRIVGHVALATDGTTYTIILDALRDAPISPNCFAL